MKKIFCGNLFRFLVCLVSLQWFTCGLILQAAAPQEFRQWTDIAGRTITARIVEISDAQSVKIELQDGRFFVVPLKNFSTADQSYIAEYSKEKGPLPSSSARATNGTTNDKNATLTPIPQSSWTLLNTGGSQAASDYSDTRLEKIIVDLNQRLVVKNVKTVTGIPLKIRTEPADLAVRVRITGALPTMNLASFVKELARINNLTVKTDAVGMIVLVDTVPAVKSGTASFFGVPITP